MNKCLTLSLALMASCSMASEVLVGSAVGFNANSERAVTQGGHVGLVLNAEHHRPLTDETGYFVSSNIYVSPAIISEDAPVSAGLVVGGLMKSSVSPMSGQIGLSIDVKNSINGQYEVAPGIMFGGIYNLTESWSLKTTSNFSFPSNKLGVYKSTDITTSIGISKTIPVSI